MNTYDEAKRNAIQKVFESIALNGTPTKEQLDFLNMVKPKKSDFNADIEKTLKTINKMFDFIGGK